MKIKPEKLLKGRATIWNGDCLALMDRIGVVDHVICDPPYEATMHKSKGKRSRNVRTDGYDMPPGVDFSDIGDARDRLMPIVKKNCRGWFLAFCTPEGVAPWRDAIERAKLRYKRACFFHKPNAAPQFNGQGPGFAVEPFVTAWAGRGVSRWNGGGRGNLFSHNINAPDREGTHGTEKPLSLMLELIELFTSPDDVVLDPFMGSGTTGIAAVALGRKFIGVEASPKYFALAKGRIQSAFMGKVEGRALISKLVGADDAGPLFTGSTDERK